jgi:hypothetical protein
MGRPSYPLLTYVNVLLLQQWYGLSDPGLEEAVDDRLSFRRFAGAVARPFDDLPLSSGVGSAQVGRGAVRVFNLQLDARGPIVRQGTLIEAALLQASVKPPSVKEGTVSERDSAAGWTKKSHRRRQQRAPSVKLDPLGSRRAHSREQRKRDQQERAVVLTIEPERCERPSERENPNAEGQHRHDDLQACSWQARHRRLPPNPKTRCSDSNRERNP